MNLAVAFRGSVADGNNKHEQVGPLFGKLRQDLHKVECPLSALQTRVAWLVVKAVEPRLKLVKDQGRGLLGEKVLQERLCWNRNPGVGMSTPIIFATRMALENQIPKRSVLLIGQGLRNRDEAFGKRQLAKRIKTRLGTPFLGPNG